MTRSEFADYFNITQQRACYFFNCAALKNEEIKKKNKWHSYKGHMTDYTLEEILLVIECSEGNLPMIKGEILKEEFDKYDHGGSVWDEKEGEMYIDGMQKFLDSKQDQPCCETCQYLTGTRMPGKGSRIFPFCNFYNRYVGLPNLTVKNIFEDYCQTFVRCDPPYRVWYKGPTPTTVQSSVLRRPLSPENE